MAHTSKVNGPRRSSGDNDRHNRRLFNATYPYARRGAINKQQQQHVHTTPTRQIGAREAIRGFGHCLHIHIVGNGALAEVGLQDGKAAIVIRQGDVDELVKVPCIPKGETKPYQTTSRDVKGREGREEGQWLAAGVACIQLKQKKKGKKLEQKAISKAAYAWR